MVLINCVHYATPSPSVLLYKVFTLQNWADSQDVACINQSHLRNDVAPKEAESEQSSVSVTSGCLLSRHAATKGSTSWEFLNAVNK